MELYQLRTFLAVAREGHLGRAAERLFISLPAVSGHVRALEEELGLELFTRTSKGMNLTEAGRRLREKAQAVVEAAGSLTESARVLRDDPGGAVRIGLNTDPGFVRMLEVVRWLRGRYPGLEPVITQGLSLVIQEAVADGDMDAGFAFGRPISDEVRLLKVCDVELCVVAPSQWAERLRELNWFGLAAEPWIWVPRECPFHSLVESEFSSRNLKLRAEVTADSEEMIRSLLMAGMGLAVMRRDEAEAMESAGKGCVWRGGNLSIELNFVYARSRERDRNVQALLEAVRAVWMV